MRWNRKSPTADYSLDVVLTNGTLIGPCVGAHLLRRDISHLFDGRCVTPNRSVPFGDIAEFRICWAENGNWQQAQCAGTKYDGRSKNVVIAN